MTEPTVRSIPLAELLLAFLVAAVPAFAANGRSDSCWDEEGTGRLWPEIHFQQAGDLDDYRRTMAQNRDEVRRTLEQEFVGVLSVLTEAGGDPEYLIEPAFSALMAFDGLHDAHRESAVRGIPAFLNAAFRGGLETLYRTHPAAAEERNLGFANPGLQERLRHAVRGAGADLSAGQERLEELRQIAAVVDLVASGTFSGDGSLHHVTLTLENVHSGKVCSYEARGELEEVASLLAESVFNEFESVDYPNARNPNPHLTWIRPVNQEADLPAETAWSYCESQGDGARLPYSLELNRAAQSGSEGAAYVAGGIPRLDPGLWVVADRRHRDDQHYYFQPLPGAPDDHPAGPVRTAGGLGAVQARFWCVRGTPDDRVVRIEALYDDYRGIAWQDPGSPALAAVEYLLQRERALGVEHRFARAFPNPDAAWAMVEAAVCSLATGPGDRVLLAALAPCAVEGEPRPGQRRRSSADSHRRRQNPGTPAAVSPTHGLRGTSRNRGHSPPG